MSVAQYSAYSQRLQAHPQVVGDPGAIAANSVPAFQFSVLTCRPGVLATKVIRPDNKEIGYGDAAFFRFKYCEVELLEDFAKVVLGYLATEPRRFIIRGQLKPDLNSDEWHRRRLLDRPGEPATIECPPRRWIVLDIDGARVPVGLGSPHRLAEAGYYIRDNLLPSYFRGIRCVAAATASTGRKGLCTARLRLFFALTEAADNEALRLWAIGLSEKFPAIDPTVFRAMQPIYTARPIFWDCTDPVPEWGRVWVLDGYEDAVELELPKIKSIRARARANSLPDSITCSDDMPDEWLELTAAYEGRGIHPIEDISDKAWIAIRSIFNSLDGCPKNGKGRHETLNRVAWWLARLVAECELTEAKARDAYFKAAEGINNSDGKYDAALIERHLDDAFADIGRAC
jgi:hypothetical protein